jgi:hypothetical protein
MSDTVRVKVSDFDSKGNYVWSSHTAALVSGNLIINLVDFIAMVYVMTLWKFKKNPYLTIRRPGLLLFNIAFFFIYDFVWTMDNLLWDVTGGIPCTYWEWARVRNFETFDFALTFGGFSSR